MHETSRALDAAAALSNLLRRAGVPHAFHGNVLTSIVSNNPQCEEILCIVEGGSNHPFRRVIQAVAGDEELTAVSSPWCNKLHVRYSRFIPAVEIEILRGGEEGPRHLDASTVINLRGVPFLTISEFIRAKLKAWMIHRHEADAQDIVYVFSHFWDQVDINRIPEADMSEFVHAYRAAAPAWSSLRKKYR